MPAAGPKSYLRVKEPGKHAIFNPESGLHVVPDPKAQYTADDAIVKAAPWAFGTEEEIAREAEERANVRSVPIGDVEQATSAPGEKRSTRRRSKVADDVVDGASKSVEVAPTPELKKDLSKDGEVSGTEENEGLEPGEKEQHPITVSGTNVDK